MRLNSAYFQVLIIFASLISAGAMADEPSKAPAKASAAKGTKLFEQKNLVAWCIVPFDAKKRGPEERAAMLERLCFKHFAYDRRAEHMSSFDTEVEALKRHDIALDAFWFPASLDDDARRILDVLRRHKIKT